MTRENFSNSFDTLLNSFAHTAQFGESNSRGDIVCDEYEKSLLLTQAQEEEILSLYTGRNVDRESFEATEEVRRYLASLVKEAALSPISNTSGKFLGLESNSKFFTLPEDLWFITYEAALITDGKCAGNTTLGIYPVRQDEYHRVRKNPFRGANDRRALRLDLSEGNVEIISKYSVISYYVRYLRKLKPIVLIDFDGEISINGISGATDCELPEILHQRILERAVMLALRSKGLVENNNENR